MGEHNLTRISAVTPAFILDKEQIIASLETLNRIREQSGCRILYSIKALPFAPVLQWIEPYVQGFSVSSLFEARLVAEVTTGQGEIHLTTPGLKAEESAELNRLCTHISFNSLTQYQYCRPYLAGVSKGLRLNPKLSFLADDRFDPCRKYSKLGIDLNRFNSMPLPEGIDGLHFHTVFSATQFEPMIKTIAQIQSILGPQFYNIKWINLGGGYLYHQIDEHSMFIELVKTLKQRFNLDVYIEPGKAVVGYAGSLMATVLDCFDSDGKTVAVLDTSVNHHPEVFEYQRQPELEQQCPQGGFSAILAGCTCLAGDIFGEYRFNQPIKIGDRLSFKNVGAYSLIKANRFNGYNLPNIYEFKNGRLYLLKQYQYQDYRNQWFQSE